MSLSPNIEEMIELLENIKGYVLDSVDSLYSASPEKLAKELDECMERLRKNDISMLKDIKTCFLPTGDYHELSIDNGWADDLGDLESDFKSLYHRILNTRPGKSPTT